MRDKRPVAQRQRSGLGKDIRPAVAFLAVAIEPAHGKFGGLADADRRGEAGGGQNGHILPNSLVA